MRYFKIQVENKDINYYPNEYSEYLHREYTEQELWEDFNHLRFVKDGNTQYYPIQFKEVNLIKE